MGNQPKAAHKSSKSIFDAHTDSKECKKVLFCKKYQLDECQADLKNNAHWSTPGGKSQLLHHVCATCLLKCKKSEHYREKIVHYSVKIDWWRLISAHWICHLLFILRVLQSPLLMSHLPSQKIWHCPSMCLAHYNRHPVWMRSVNTMSFLTSKTS